MSLFLSTESIMPMISSGGRDVMKNLATLLLRHQDVQVGATYQHYKGNLYEVMAIAHHSENPALQLVVYKALYNSPGFGENSVWVRPYDMFAEQVMIDGVQVNRFTKIDHTRLNKNRPD